MPPSGPRADPLDAATQSPGEGAPPAAESEPRAGSRVGDCDLLADAVHYAHRRGHKPAHIIIARVRRPVIRAQTRNQGLRAWAKTGTGTSQTRSQSPFSHAGTGNSQTRSRSPFSHELNRKGHNA
jgi:hypothetical protein